MYRILRDRRFAICFYGWNHADTFVTAFKKAGFRIVGHFVFAKHYASRKGYTEARHECAYLLAKGNPNTPAKALPDVMPWGCIYGQQTASDTEAIGDIAPSHQILLRCW